MVSTVFKCHLSYSYSLPSLPIKDVFFEELTSRQLVSKLQNYEHTMYPYLHPYTGCPRKKLCSRGITYWGNNFRLIFTIKVSLESSMNLFIKSKLLWLIWTPGKLVEMDSPCGFTPILVPMTVWVLHAVFRIHIILIWIRIRGSVSVIMDPDPDPDTDPDPDPDPR